MHIPPYQKENEVFKMKDLSNISVVLPSLDPDEKLHQVIDGLLEYGFSHIILVNDGSKPENLHYFEDEVSAHPDVITLLHHEVNKGKGAALKNAFNWFLKNRPEGAGVVTVDGDNQHHPADTRACTEHMLETGHITLGCRDFNQADVPARSSFGNKTTSAIFKIFVGMTISDTQTGLRAFPREELELMASISGDRFEYETNMLLAMKQNGIPFDEVKIRTVYIEENKSSHFRVIHDSWRIYKLILAHFFRYTLSSLASAVVETGLLAIFNLLLKNLLDGVAFTAATTIPARILSCLFNFFLNKNLVFKSNVSTATAMLRYWTLAFFQMMAQFLMDEGCYMLFHVGTAATGIRVLIHTLVMTVLYFMSFMIQQRWVFAAEKKEKEKV